MIPSATNTIRISIRRQQPALLSKRTTTALFSTATSTTDESSSLGSDLSRLLTTEQKSLLRQAHQLAAQSRNLARGVGKVAVREDSLLSEIVRLKNQQIGKEKQCGTTSQIIPTAPDTCVNADDDDLPPSLFTVVFAGEFNSGKSTLINALLGKELLESGVLPTTDAITVLMGDENDANDTSKQSTVINESHMDTTTSIPAQLQLLPITKFPLLSDLCLIDTPGTNAIMTLQHTTSTLRILHNADLLVFVTSADRPFSESEKELLRTCITYRKRVLVVINKMDILERQQGEDHGDVSKRRVIEYVTEHASELLGGRPVVIPVSGRDALLVKMLGGKREEDGIWKRCNFGTLESL
jgi:small GTP-binding protein